VEFYMALVKRLAAEEGCERHVCQVGSWANVLESWRARERNRYRSVLGLPCPYPWEPATDKANNPHEAAHSQSVMEEIVSQ
jgi:hypothetical protein